MEPASPQPQQTPPAALDVIDMSFRDKLIIATLSLLFLALLVLILDRGRVILQPLFIAVFIGYLILPIHNWIVARGVPSALAYVLIVLLVVGVLFGVGTMVFTSAEKITTTLPVYEAKVERAFQWGLTVLPMELPELKNKQLRDLFSIEVEWRDIALALGSIREFISGLVVVFIYLVFLIAEKISFPRRLELAFSEPRNTEISEVIGKINLAISQYIAVKTFVSVLAGALSLAVLAVFNVDFFVLWGILIALLNFIPYVGSLVAVAPPIILALLDNVWTGLAVAILLMAIQQVIGTFVEPRMAGRRLNVSPLLILLSLFFWGLLWGIPGMILAVPILVTVRIILENIDETKPLARLISNV